MKKLMVGVVVVLGTCFLILLLVPYLVDLDRFRGTVATRVQDAIGRKVDLDGIRLTIIPRLGAEISGLRIADNPVFSSQDFLVIDRFQIRVSLLSLLKKEIKVTGVAMKDPVVRLARNARGEFSFSDLLEPRAETDATDPLQKTPPAGLIAALFVQDLVLKGGELFYTDELLLPGTGPLLVERIDLRTRDVSLHTPIEIDLSASFLHPARENIHLRGIVGPIGEEIRPEAIPFDLQVRLDETALDDTGLKLPVSLMGRASGAVSLRGMLSQKIEADTELVLRDFVLPRKGGERPKSAAEKLFLKIAGRVALEYPSQTILVDSVAITVNEITATAAGKIEKLFSTPQWNLSLESDSLDVTEVLSILPGTMGSLPPELVVAGTTRVEAEVIGTPTASEVSADLVMDEMKISYGEFFSKQPGKPLSARAQIGLEALLLTIGDLNLTLDQSTVHAGGTVNMAGDTPVIDLQMKTRALPLENLAAYVPIASEYAPEGELILDAGLRGKAEDLRITLAGSLERLSVLLPQEEGAATGGARERVILSGVGFDGAARTAEKTTANLAARISRVAAFSHVMRDVSATVSYTPEQILVDSFAMNGFRGSLKGNASYSVPNGTWRAAPVFRDMAAGELLGAFTPHGQNFSGVLSGSMEIQGSTAKPGLAGVSATGDLQLTQGQWMNFDLTGSSLDELLSIQGFEELLGISKSEIEQYRMSRFDFLKVRFTLADTVATIPGLELSNIHIGKDTGSLATLAGSTNLASGALDLTGRVILSKA
ncbi:MAG: AsmA family protein, partial [Desulfomonilia bacterium]|nr:AsmA family protein [Desulfomonilia bacterium]